MKEVTFGEVLELKNPEAGGRKLRQADES